MKHRIGVVLFFVLALGWSTTGIVAQVVQLKTGEVLVAKVADAHEDGLEVHRLDNGGVLELRWDQLSADSASRIKTAWNLAVDDEGEVMVSAELFRFELASGVQEEVTGRVVAQDGSTITVRRQGMNYPIQRSRIRYRAQVELPARDVYSGEEFYNEKLAEIAPGDDADKHIQLADVLTRVRDYEHAGQHLQEALALGTSRQQSLLQGKIDRLAKFAAARAEREHLDQIGVALARKNFAKGMTLLEEFELTYPNSKLRQEFLRAQQRFLKSRERHLLYRVTELWYAEAARIADRKSGQSGVTFESAKEYAEEDMGDDIRARVRKVLEIEADEVEDLWARRLDDGQRKPRPQRYSYGVGSWTLGQAAILKGTNAAKQVAANQPEGNKEVERMVERIRKAQERARRALQSQAGSEKESTPETWWEGASRDERKVWLRAYYAEFGGDLAVVNAHLNPCVTCASEGRLTVFGQSGKAQKVECPTCRTTRFRRWIRAH